MGYASSVLNIAWLAVSLAAFTWFLLSTSRRSQHCSRRVVMCRALALGLAVVSLFPCVSASDDALRLAQLNSQFTGDVPDQISKPDAHPGTELLATLVGLLEVLESAQVAAILAFCISLCLFTLALALSPASLDRFLPACPGRAPPRLSL